MVERRADHLPMQIVEHALLRLDTARTDPGGRCRRRAGQRSRATRCWSRSPSLANLEAIRIGEADRIGTRLEEPVVAQIPGEKPQLPAHPANADDDAPLLFVVVEVAVLQEMLGRCSEMVEGFPAVRGVGPLDRVEQQVAQGGDPGIVDSCSTSGPHATSRLQDRVHLLEEVDEHLQILGDDLGGDLTVCTTTLVAFGAHGSVLIKANSVSADLAFADNTPKLGDLDTPPEKVHSDASSIAVCEL